MKKKMQNVVYKSDSKLEKNFQRNLIKDIKEKFPDSIVMKTDASQIQGIPDLLVLNDNKWAALECKRHKKAHRQPNQEYYVDKMNKMSFARFVYPENKEEVLDELSKTFKR